MPLRSHREHEADDNSEDTDGASNHGNFVALVKFRARYDNILAVHFKYPSKNAAYMSNAIQDELLQILGSQIRSNIAKEVKHVKHYSILADEVTDISRHEQVFSVFEVCG